MADEKSDKNDALSSTVVERRYPKRNTRTDPYPLVENQEKDKIANEDVADQKGVGGADVEASPSMQNSKILNDFFQSVLKSGGDGGAPIPGSKDEEKEVGQGTMAKIDISKQLDEIQSLKKELMKTQQQLMVSSADVKSKSALIEKLQHKVAVLEEEKATWNMEASKNREIARQLSKKLGASELKIKELLAEKEANDAAMSGFKAKVRKYEEDKNISAKTYAEAVKKELNNELPSILLYEVPVHEIREKSMATVRQLSAET